MSWNERKIVVYIGNLESLGTRDKTSLINNHLIKLCLIVSVIFGQVLLSVYYHKHVSEGINLSNVDYELR